MTVFQKVVLYEGILALCLFGLIVSLRVDSQDQKIRQLQGDETSRVISYHYTGYSETGSPLAEIEGWVEDWQIKDIKNNHFEPNYCGDKWTNWVSMWIEADSSEEAHHKIHVSIWEEKRGKK